MVVESIRLSALKGEEFEDGESRMLEATDEVDNSENIESTELRIELEIDELCWCLFVEAWIMSGLLANVANSM